MTELISNQNVRHPPTRPNHVWSPGSAPMNTNCTPVPVFVQILHLCLYFNVHSRLSNRTNTVVQSEKYTRTKEPRNISGTPTHVCFLVTTRFVVVSTAEPSESGSDNVGIDIQLAQKTMRCNHMYPMPMFRKAVIRIGGNTRDQKQGDKAVVCVDGRISPNILNVSTTSACRPPLCKNPDAQNGGR